MIRERIERGACHASPALFQSSSLSKSALKVFAIEYDVVVFLDAFAFKFHLRRAKRQAVLRTSRFGPGIVLVLDLSEDRDADGFLALLDAVAAFEPLLEGEDVGVGDALRDKGGEWDRAGNQRQL